MSGLFNLVLVLILAALSVLFALYNQEEIALFFPGGIRFPEVPIFVLAFVTMFFGFFLGVISGFSRRIKYRKRLDALRGQNKELERELTNLRNLPLDSETQL